MGKMRNLVRKGLLLRKKDERKQQRQLPVATLVNRFQYHTSQSNMVYAVMRQTRLNCVVGARAWATAVAGRVSKAGAQRVVLMQCVRHFLSDWRRHQQVVVADMGF